MKFVGITYPHPQVRVEVSTYDLEVIRDALLFHASQNHGEERGGESDRVLSLLARVLEKVRT